MYRLQNIAVAVSAFSAFVTSFLSPGHFFYWSFMLSTILHGAVSSVGCQGSALSVEREWTKALCQGDSASLASLNAGALQRVEAAAQASNGLLLIVCIDASRGLHAGLHLFTCIVLASGIEQLPA